MNRRILIITAVVFVVVFLAIGYGGLAFSGRSGTTSNSEPHVFCLPSYAGGIVYRDSFGGYNYLNKSGGASTFVGGILAQGRTDYQDCPR